MKSYNRTFNLIKVGISHSVIIESMSITQVEMLKFQHEKQKLLNLSKKNK